MCVITPTGRLSAHTTLNIHRRRQQVEIPPGDKYTDTQSSPGLQWAAGDVSESGAEANQ